MCVCVVVGDLHGGWHPGTFINIAWISNFRLNSSKSLTSATTGSTVPVRNFLHRLIRLLAPVSAAMPRKQQQIAAVIEAQRAVTARRIVHIRVRMRARVGGGGGGV